MDWAPAPPPPPVLPDALREEVPAKIQPQGDFNPPVTDISLKGNPDDILKGLTEDPTARTENANVFQVGGADHIAQVFAGPVNYQDETGDWVPISSDLVDDGKQGLQNEANAFTTDFPPQLSAKSPVTVTLKEGSFTFAPETGQADLVKDDQTSLTYAGMLPGVDLSYAQTNTGLVETITLASPAAIAPSFDLSSSDLSFRWEETGEISILSGKDVVGIIPAPAAFDSSVDEVGEPGRGTATQVLTDLGGGTWRVETIVDPTFLATAKYPVVVDPGETTLNPSRDTWVDEASPDSNYETGANSDELRAGYAVANYLRYGYLKFPLTNLRAPGRLVYSGLMSLWATYVVNNSVNVNVKRVNVDWPTTVTWNTKPGVDDAQGVWAAVHGDVNTWYQFDLAALYQNIIDSNINWDNYGVRIGGDGSTPQTDNYHRFASSKTGIPGGQPQLYISYNDLPSAPALDWPNDGRVFTYSSPGLRVVAPVSDPNGDPVLVNYQISTSTDFSAPVVESGWMNDNASWVVPAGVLQDGQPYYWRAQAWDVCDPDTGGLCDLKGKPNPVSAVRSFTIALNHFGADDRWPMWRTSLGNAMNLGVNEASGNLYLNYPLDSLATPAGALDLSLSYNHQDGGDNGLGQGWWISAGPGSDPKDLPTKLTEVDSGNAVRISLKDGDENYFAKVDATGSPFYQGSGTQSGTVQKNNDGTWLFTTSDGGQYTFSSTGNLATANPATNTVSSKGFSYVFSAAGHIQTVTDPLNRVIHFNWNAQDTQLQTITTWDNPVRTWTFVYDPALSTMIKTVTDPQGGVVTFGYNDTPRRLISVLDGSNFETDIVYGAAPPGVPKAQVAGVTGPGYGTNDKTEFTYSGPYTGQVAAQAVVKDPRYNDPGVQAANFTTTIDIDKNGLPVRITAPVNTLGYPPVTTMVWDKNGNLVCKRGPAANAKVLKCLATDYATDGLQTDYTYETKAPYRVLTITGPAPNIDGTGTRAVRTYANDQNISGLLMAGYNNPQLTGIPATETVDSASTLDHDWGSGGPPGLPTDNFSVRWTGILHVATTKNYKFRIKSDDGSTLIVGTTLVADCFGQVKAYSTYNCDNHDTTIKLTAGDVPIEVNYSELTGTTAHVTLQWNDTGTFAPIPVSSYAPALGLLTTETDPLGTHTYAYSDATYQVRHLPSSVTRSGGTDPSRTTTYTYDTYGRVLTDQNFAGTITNVFQADSTLKDCLSTVTDRAGAVITYDCDSAGDITSITQSIAAKDLQPAQSRVTTKTYDGVGRLKTVSTSDGSVTRTITYTYNGSGRLTQVDDAAGGSTRTTTYDYDTHGRLWHETLPDPDGGGPITPSVTTHFYDQVGNETKTTDALSRDWTKDYDGLNRVICSANPYGNCRVTPYTGPVTTTVYDDTGQGTGGTLGVPTVKVTDPGGVATTTKLDVLGRKISSQLGDLNAETYEYDAVGNVTKITDPTAVVATSTYDAFGEVKTTTTKGGLNHADAVTTFTYDQAGRMSPVVDANGNSMSYGYDGMGRITSVTPPGLGQGENPWAIDYDSAGERVRITDTNNRVRDWTYDLLGRLSTYRETRATGYVCPRSGTNVCLSTYHYTAFSELSSVDDPRNITQNYLYDNMGRTTQRYGVSNSQTVDQEIYGYNKVSSLTSAIGGGVTATLGYDNAQRLTSVTEGSASTSYVFSPTNDRLTSRTDNAGTTSFGYDTYGRINSITTPFSATPVGYTFDAAGRQLARTDPSGLTTTRGYDTPYTGRLLSESVKNSSQTTLASFAYTFDPVSSVLTAAQTLPGNADSGTWAYTYDAQNRLKTAQLGTNPITTYGYDGAGNRTSVQVGTGNPVTTSYDTAGIPTSASDGTTYGFDAVGNLTSLAGPRVWTFTYDSWNRTKTAKGPSNNPNITYTNDGLSRMTKRVRNSTTTNYYYVGTGEDPATTVTGSTTTKYAYDSGGPLAQSVSGTVKIYLPNLHGDLSLIANTSGSVTGTQAYKPYGEKGAGTGDTSYFSFQSDPTDSDTGLVDMGARLYDPTMGRFSTRDLLLGDSAAPLSLNQFVYGWDNPVSLWDPNGMCVGLILLPDCYNPKVEQTHHEIQDNPGGASWHGAHVTPKDETRVRPPSPGSPPRAPAPPKPIITVSTPMVQHLLVINNEPFFDPDNWLARYQRSKATNFYINLPDSAWATEQAQKAGGQCDKPNFDLIIICYHTPTPGNVSAFTWGNVITTPKRQGQLGAALYTHERRHALQWAELRDFPDSYIYGVLGSNLFGGDSFCFNPIEIEAGLHAGGYDCPNG